MTRNDEMKKSVQKRPKMTGNDKKCQKMIQKLAQYQCLMGRSCLPTFVSRKITNAVAEISLGLKDKLVLGNLKAKRDWGFAVEYMDAIHKILQQDKPDNFVICTGESHAVSDFVKEAFDIVGLNWKKYVKTEKKFFRPIEIDYLRGNAKKAAEQLK